MSFTIGDIVTKTRRLLADNESPYRFNGTELIANVFSAEREAVRVLPAEAYPKLWVTTKRNLVSGVNTYEVPSDLWRLSGVIQYGNSALSTAASVNITPQEEKAGLYAQSGTHVPAASFRAGLFQDNIFYVLPTPTQTIANGLEFDYMQAVPDGADTLSLLVGDSVGDAMAWYAAALTIEYEDPERARGYRAQFYQMMAEEAQVYKMMPTAVRG